MSCNYADGLSPYPNKGKLGLAEKFDTFDEVLCKVKQLAEWINTSEHVVIHTGAGISTSAGIPDFRGPTGVWTLEEKGQKPNINISFDEAIPTRTHMAIVELVNKGKVHFVVSQNIDGLHLRSGLPRKNLAELHGNMYIEQCRHCNRQFIRKQPTTSVGQKCLQIACRGDNLNGRPCRGKLHDTILDWEHQLPEKDLGLADFHSCIADLCICLGTTLQIIPSGNLPLCAKKYNSGKLVICNLQPTKHDKKADLIINTYVDKMMGHLMNELNLDIPEYNQETDPTIISDSISSAEWTILDIEVKRMRLWYEKKCTKRRNSKNNNKPKLKKPKINFELELNAKEDVGKIINIKEEIVENNNLKSESLDFYHSDSKVEEQRDISLVKLEAKDTNFVATKLSNQLNNGIDGQ